MLFQTAQSEIFLLIFSLLVPCGIVAMGVAGLVRGTAEGLDESAGKRFEKLLVVPAAFIVVGLIAAVAHVGYPAHIFDMANGFGMSPLSNEIVVAGCSAVVALVYWIVSLAKHPSERYHRGFGVAVLILGIFTAVMTGFAYMMPTIQTWNTPLAWIGQFFNACLGGSVLGALVLEISDVREKSATKVLAIAAMVAAAGAAVCVFAQGSVASGAMTSAGATLASSMGAYYGCAVAALVCMVAAVAAWLVPARKGKANVASIVVALVLVAIALVLIRIDFYGIFLTVGII